MVESMLIVHADDFGISVPVNDGILRAYNDGILTSTSIMANALAFDDAIEKTQRTAGLDVGIHLTLIEEAPLCELGIIPSLISDNQRFYGHATIFFKRYLAGKIRLADIEKELEAQIVKVMNTGISVSHLDSHQHLHILPGIMKIIMRLASKYQIKAIRYPRERLNRYMLNETKYFSRIAQMLFINILSTWSRSTEMLSPDSFFGFYFGGRVNTQNLNILLDRNKFIGICELMCHPGEVDTSQKYTHWGYHWDDELNALLNQEIKQKIKDKGIQLASYRDL